MIATDTRAAYIAGLRRIADALEADPDVAMPFSGNAGGTPFYVFIHEGSGSREQVAAWARLLDSGARKVYDDESNAFGFELHGQVAGVQVKVCAARDLVCTRRVVGTREVVEQVADPEALAAVPTVTVTRTEDVVEWDCSPLLAPEPVSA